ncbi:ParB/RepB/Spo0J family partition protein [Salmonella enterica]|nr:ParB/RepB/Spo0J family partition protein [Salmonella enterica]EEH5466552.1 ParB/RepB/Spo0J family partition protein [Salmonella enterica]EEH7556051.1 ParB/RepB/Spo0J family partition protein [Salmonella enterica]EEO5640252.1 ParB/RepB/Spo0J family partition protein [Salmonella enterica]EEQ0204218.1 ParB/RepB/Spo0J family partition protein [Salmonella enterica]
MARKPFMRRLQEQQEMKKNTAVVSDIEQIIANKQPDEHSHDASAHQLLTDIARPDIEPEGQIIRVDINLVYAEEQVRPEEDFEEEVIDGMSDTFETIGMLTPPRCYPRDRRGYLIWLGETRVRTARKRGDTHIDIYVGKPPRERKERIIGQLIENLQQSGLKPLATAKSFYELKHEFKMTGEQIAKTMGKPTSFVSKHLRLIDAPENVTALLRDKVTSDIDLAYTLIQLNEKAPKEADKLIAAARESGISRAQVKAALDSVKEKQKGDISHAKSEAHNKKPAKQRNEESGIKTWQVVVEIDGQPGVIMTDRAPEEDGYVWVKLEIGEISIEASDIRVTGLRLLQ